MAASTWLLAMPGLLIALLAHVFHCAGAASSPHRSHTVQIDPEGHQSHRSSRPAKKGLLRRDVIAEPPRQAETMRREVMSDASLLQNAPPKQSMSADTNQSSILQMMDEIKGEVKGQKNNKTEDAKIKENSSEKEMVHSTKVKDPMTKAGDLQLFNIFDENHDDRLQAKEVLALMKRIGVSTNTFDWSEYDLDQKGYLTEEEFLRAGPAVFKAAQEDAALIFPKVEKKPKKPKKVVNETAAMLEREREALSKVRVINEPKQKVQEDDNSDDSTSNSDATTDEDNDTDDTASTASTDDTDSTAGDEDSTDDTDSSDSLSESNSSEEKPADSETSTEESTDDDSDSAQDEDSSDGDTIESPEVAASFAELTDDWGPQDMDFHSTMSHMQGLRETLGDEFHKSKAFTKDGLKTFATVMKLGEVSNAHEVDEHAMRRIQNLHHHADDGITWHEFENHMSSLMEPPYGNGVAGPPRPSHLLPERRTRQRPKTREEAREKAKRMFKAML